MRMFYCYSPNLKKFLLENGCKYLHIGINQRTNKNFWLFEGDEKLNELLKKWRENKQ